MRLYLSTETVFHRLIEEPFLLRRPAWLAITCPPDHMLGVIQS